MKEGKLLIFLILMTNMNFVYGATRGEVVIKARVPKICNMNLVMGNISNLLELEKKGQHRIYAGDIDLQCNMPDGYSIVLHSENEFKLSLKNIIPNDDKSNVVPYDIEIENFSLSDNISKMDKQFFPQTISKKLNQKLKVYMKYEVGELGPGSYEDHLKFSIRSDG